MELTRLVRRLVVSLVLAVSLTAWKAPPEISSEAFEIPLVDRAVIPGLEGMQWVIMLDDDDKPGYRILQVRLNNDRSYALQMVGDGDDDPQNFTFVATNDPDTFVGVYQDGVIDNPGKNYFLLSRSRAGSWAMQIFLGSLDSVQEGARAAYLEPIMRGHGFVVEQDDYGLSLGAVPSTTALRNLFSDSEFLAGIHNYPAPFFYFLPMNTIGLPDGSAADLWWDEIGEQKFMSQRFEPEAAELVGLADLAKEWLNTVPDGAVEAYEDGSLGFGFDDGDYAAMSLVDLGYDNRYLAVETDREYIFDEPIDDIAPIDTNVFKIVELVDGGINITPLNLTTYDFSLRLQEIAESQREAVLARHGLTMVAGVISGNVSTEAIRSLLKDPAFQIGLWGGESEDLTLAPINSDPAGS